MSENRATNIKKNEHLPDSSRSQTNSLWLILLSSFYRMKRTQWTCYWSEKGIYRLILFCFVQIKEVNRPIDAFKQHNPFCLYSFYGHSNSKINLLFLYSILFSPVELFFIRLFFFQLGIEWMCKVDTASGEIPKNEMLFDWLLTRFASSVLFFYLKSQNQHCFVRIYIVHACFVSIFFPLFTGRGLFTVLLLLM